jgi:hypothetical protein
MQKEQQEWPIVNCPNVGFELTKYVKQTCAVLTQQVLQQQVGLQPTTSAVSSHQDAGAGAMAIGPLPGTDSATGISDQ